jgi:uncharacterized protein
MAVAVAFHWLGAATPTGIAERMSTVVLAAGYGASIIWAMECTAARSWLAWVAPAGRMALTNYLMQSVVLGCIFYGYGLGLFGRLGIAEAMAIGIVVYVAQIAVSAWWLRHHAFGPMEWVWRAATYGGTTLVRQP